MTNFGAPAEMVAQMRTQPMWPAFEAVAHRLVIVSRGADARARRPVARCGSGDARAGVAGVLRRLRSGHDDLPTVMLPMRSEDVKYMLLIYDNPDTRDIFFGEGGRELMAEMNGLMRELQQSGELIGTEGLADPSNTKTVRVQGGVPVVTDGPLAEAKEHFGGYLVVDCESLERAVEIAARWPNARFSAMEVRPIMDPGGGDV
jgi:hypothetical protein